MHIFSLWSHHKRTDVKLVVKYDPMKTDSVRRLNDSRGGRLKAAQFMRLADRVTGCFFELLRMRQDLHRRWRFLVRRGRIS